MTPGPDGNLATAVRDEGSGHVIQILTRKLAASGFGNDGRD